VVVEEGDIVGIRRQVAQEEGWSVATVFSKAAPRSIWLSFIMAPGEGLLYPGKFWLGWERTVWEEQAPATEEVEEEAISRVVGEITQVVEEEVVMGIPIYLSLPSTHRERTAVRDGRTFFIRFQEKLKI
jgi:hypothetical protein